MTDVVHYHHQPIIWKLIFGFLCSWLNKTLQYSLVSKFQFPVLHMQRKWQRKKAC